MNLRDRRVVDPVEQARQFRQLGTQQFGGNVGRGRKYQVAGMKPLFDAVTAADHGPARIKEFDRRDSLAGADIAACVLRQNLDQSLHATREGEGFLRQSLVPGDQLFQQNSGGETAKFLFQRRQPRQRGARAGFFRIAGQHRGEIGVEGQLQNFRSESAADEIGGAFPV